MFMGNLPEGHAVWFAAPIFLEKGLSRCRDREGLTGWRTEAQFLPGEWSMRWQGCLLTGFRRVHLFFGGTSEICAFSPFGFPSKPQKLTS